jgi:hypothetical protein
VNVVAANDLGVNPLGILAGVAWSMVRGVLAMVHVTPIQAGIGLLAFVGVAIGNQVIGAILGRGKWSLYSEKKGAD